MGGILALALKKKLTRADKTLLYEVLVGRPSDTSALWT